MLKKSSFKRKSYEELISNAVLKSLSKLEASRNTLKPPKTARGGFKKKKAGKVRTPLKKVSKQPISRLQRKLWEECKRIIRIRYPNVCYTCGRSGLEGSNWHTGHMWAKASVGANLKYDLRILRPQCYFCNVNCGGRGAEFYARMLEENGYEYMQNLANERNDTVKAYDYYLWLLEQYKVINI